ncbi:hypothetical protein WSM22_04360 [Cytophagales bacterium WSM2-2]|nr:hypothetical protein WSM22_04360 [Cytophagales bacterium WSM2-2]
MSTFLAYSSAASVIIPIVIYFIGGRYNGTNKWIFILTVTSLVADIANVLYLKAGFTGYTILNIFFLVQIFLLSVIYARLLDEPDHVGGLFLCFFSIWVINFLFMQPISEYQSLLRLLGNALVLGYAISYYHRIYKVMPIKDIKTYGPVWFNNAVLYYFSLNFFLFAATHYIVTSESSDVAIIFWGFHNFNNIIKNCLYAVAIYYGGKIVSRVPTESKYY